ncbi:hypothetical protein BT63DRAFT_453533 [Microthyrium microscopicum]|uniref:Uncharacterized protein n=1 Tax=Microthyrium microscopicum TaxID=703497 RepID=A0A6A6UHI2_9PEZI|nr:hypothetical protein BT63DRAFT_453533 [Microthyrium microscopicum]
MFSQVFNLINKPEHYFNLTFLFNNQQQPTYPKQSPKQSTIMKHFNVLFLAALSLLSGVNGRLQTAQGNALVERSAEVLASSDVLAAKPPPKVKCNRRRDVNGLMKRNDRGGWNPNNIEYHPGDIVTGHDGVRYSCRVQHHSTELTKPDNHTDYSFGFWAVCA